MMMELPMDDFLYAMNVNIKRFQDLLETAVDATERQTIQALLDQEKAKAAPAVAEPKAK